MVYWSISSPVAMLQLSFFFFLKSYFIRRRLMSSSTLGCQHTPHHNLIMTQTQLGVAECGHSPDLLYTSSLRVKPVVVNPRKILCTYYYFFFFTLVYMIEKTQGDKAVVWSRHGLTQLVSMI